MRRSTFLKVAILPLVTYGCGGGGATLPNLPGTNSSDYVLRPETRVIPNDGSIVLESQTDTTLVLRGAVPPLAAGQVVLSLLGVGALRKVTSVAQVGDRLTLTTTQAHLTDAFSKLTYRMDRPWGKEVFGELASLVEGINLRWVDAIPGVDPGRSRVGGSTGSAVAVEFENGFSLGAGITVSGTAYFRLNPILNVDIDWPSLFSGPVLQLFEVGITPQTGGSVTIAAQGNASYSGEKILVDKYFSPIVSFPFVFLPNLKIKVVVDANAEAELSASGGIDVTGNAWARWTKTGGWQKNTNVTGSASGGVADAEGAFSASVKIIAQLGLYLYGVAGPYANFGPALTGSGSFTTKSADECGIQAKLEASLGGAIGIGINDSLKDLLDEDMPSFELPFTAKTWPLGDFFFPFPSVTVTVTDNGPFQDDVFSVSLDGKPLGQTPLGGTRAFPFCPIKVGQHTLTLKADESGAPHGGPDKAYATWAVGLDHGATFADGNGDQMGHLDEGASTTLTFTVPKPVPGRSHTAPIPLRRNPAPE